MSEPVTSLPLLSIAIVLPVLGALALLAIPNRDDAERRI